MDLHCSNLVREYRGMYNTYKHSYNDRHNPRVSIDMQYSALYKL